jgi:predicted transcriptional regulator
MNDSPSPKDSPSLGEQELDALRFIAEHSPISVGEAAKSYGSPRGLARTTVLTVMERLRAKGYLSRRLVGGVYRYSARIDQNAVLKNVVAEFVDRSLGGSLSPFVMYLADSGRLRPDELQALRKIVDSLEAEEPAR